MKTQNLSLKLPRIKFRDIYNKQKPQFMRSMI